MSFMEFIFLALIFLIICEAKKKAHWTDFVPNRNSDGNEDHITTPQSKDPQKSLNLISKENKRLSDQFKDEIPAGHTNRHKMISLIEQRDKQEEKLYNILIGGIIARKLNHKASHCLFNCAFEERTKSQQVQGQIDQVKSEGQTDQRVERFRRRIDMLSRSTEQKKWQEYRERIKSRNDKYHQLKRMKRQ